MRLLIFFLFSISPRLTNGQSYQTVSSYESPAEFDNIHVQKIAEDSLQSSFIIWIKKEVKGHFHQTHTENIVVLEGKAEMLFGDKKIIVQAGDYINIPKGTKHSVFRVIGDKPMKVLSIQSPKFDGTDRVFIQE
jgi:quercetin dioxygenase-like cupin family protein